MLNDRVHTQGKQVLCVHCFVYMCMCTGMEEERKESGVCAHVCACVCVCACMHAYTIDMVSAWYSSPSSVVLMESVTFSPGPAPVTARTDISYMVLIINPATVKVITFCCASPGPVTLLNPESPVLLAEMICKGAGVNINPSMIHAEQQLVKAGQDEVSLVDLHIATLHAQHTLTSYRSSRPLNKTGLVHVTLTLVEVSTSSIKFCGAKGAVEVGRVVRREGSEKGGE